MPDRRGEQLIQRPDFQAFADHFESVVIWAGDENGFDFISSGYENIWGRPVEDVRGDMSALLEGVHPDDVDEVLATMGDDSVLEDGETETLEHRVVRPNGEVRWVEVRIVPLHDDDGELTEVVGVTLDITDQKRSELDLRQQNERLEEFANVVSHDLRNPLSVATGRLELARSLTTDDRLEEELVAIEDAHSRMERIIEDLLWLARKGRAIGSRTPTDLDSVVKSAWAQVDTGTATLEADCSVTVAVDVDRLEQLFENLLRNSVEHGSTSNRTQFEHGSTDAQSASDGLTVRVGLLGGRRGFYLEDTGPGIPVDERESIFEPGYSTTPGGTGFGLSIVKTVAEAHGWTVDVVESDDGGARVEFVGVEFDGYDTPS